MIYKIELADRSFTKLDELQFEATALSWEYSRNGGCGSFSFQLPKEYCTERNLGGFFNIKIKRKNPSTGSYELKYQGEIQSKTPSINGSQEVMTIAGHGYQRQLQNIYIDADYASTEVSAIVKDLLDNYIVPNSDITYDASSIVATTFTATDLKFNTNALNCMQTLADLVGTREWGVDKDRKFFFVARNESEGNIYALEHGRVANFNSQDDFSSVVNRVIVRGGDVSGTPFEETFDQANSQAKYGRRDKVIQNSAIRNSADATQFADAVFSEFQDIVRKGSCTIIPTKPDEEIFFEDDRPIPLFRLKVRGVFYGERKYGTFLYAGSINYQINRINYSVDDIGTLTIRLTLGQLRSSVAESISQLEYKLDQVSSEAV